VSTEIRGVVFDLDGLLLDTEQILRRVDAEALARYGAILTVALHQRTLGMSHEAKNRLFVEELGLPVTPEALGAERSARFAELLPTARLMPGAAELVAALAAARVSLAIATGSTADAARAKLARHPEIGSAMRAIATCDHPRVRRLKPAPDIFLAAAHEMGIDPGACLAFEDAPAGVESALAAGMRVIAVPDRDLPHHPVFARADRVLASLLDFDPVPYGIRTG
jgi:beta-phosphoglucomutase-like phosphatase (HAD superfamily)